MSNENNPYKLLIAVFCAAILFILLCVIGWDCYVQFAVLERHGNAMTDLVLIMMIMVIAFIVQREFKL